MPPFPSKSGLLWRFLLRPLVFALPFAIFFLVLTGSPPAEFADFYIASLIFATCIVLLVEANQRWVVPRIAPRGRARAGAPLIAEVASFAVSSILGSVVAALILNSTIAP